jgi:hypothetical protein
MTTRIVAYEDDYGVLRTYTLAHTEQQEHDARYDCALDKRIPLDRVVVLPHTTPTAAAKP